MKFTLIFLFSFFIFHITFSQNDFREGYIITKENDTVSGYVDYKIGSRKHEICSYKKTKEQKDDTRYTPQQINGYGFVGDRFYKSKSISVSQNENEKVFLEVLIKGKASLYKFQSYFFIEKESDVFRQLSNDNTNVGIVSSANDRFRGELSYFVSDCKQIKNNRIQSVRFSEKPLINLIKDYNECLNAPSTVYLKDKPWFKANAGISLGINFASIEVDESLDEEEFNFFSSELGSTTSVTFGAFVDISSPRINERISLHTGLFYLSSNFEKSSERSTRFFNYSYDATTKIEQIKIPVGIKYTFPEKTITPYLSLGILNNIILESEVNWKTERERLVNSRIDNFEESSNLDSIKSGFWAGIGAKKQLNEGLNMLFELRYDSSQGNVGRDRFQQRYKYNLQNFQVLIGLSI